MKVCYQALALTLLTACSLHGLENIPQKAAPLAPPEKELTAAAKEWQLKNLAERLAQPGAAGVQDVFWEVLQLYEKEPKARKDHDLEVLMDWMLFSANLWNNPNTSEPALIKLPPLVPASGAKLLDKCINKWMTNLGGGGEDRYVPAGPGTAPWQWPEFSRIDPTVLAAAVRRALEPSHNPQARLWLAAALLACGDAEGQKELATARALVEKNYSVQGGHTYAQILDSLINAGVRQALPLLIEQAEQHKETPQPSDEGAFSSPQQQALTRICQLLGWNWTPTQAENEGNKPAPTDYKVEFARLRSWLKTHMSELVWDPARRRFTGNAPPPGWETIWKAAVAVEKKFGLKCLVSIAQGRDARQTVQGVLDLIEKSTAAANDEDVGTLLLELLQQPATDCWWAIEGNRRLLVQVPKLNPKLGAKVWTTALQRSLTSPGHGSVGLFMVTEADPAIVKEACATLLPEEQKKYDEARAAGNIDGALQSAMRLLILGAKPDRKQLAELIEKAPLEWTGAGRDQSKFRHWGDTLGGVNRTGSLRLLLATSTGELANYGKKRQSFDSLGLFQHRCGWTDSVEGIMAGTGEEVLAKCEAWLDENEAKLKWDQKKNRFVGALSPEKAALERSLQPLVRSGIKVDELLDAQRYGQREAARRLIDSTLRAVGNPQFAKDPELGSALDSLAALAQGEGPVDTTLRNLLIALSRIDHAAGVKLWSAQIRRDLDTWFKGGGLKPLTEAAVTKGFATLAEEIDPTVLKDARALLLPAYQAELNEKKEMDVEHRAICALICIYLGADIDDAALLKLFAEAGKLPRQLFLEAAASHICGTGNPAGLRALLLIAKAGTERTRRQAMYSFEVHTGLAYEAARPMFSHDSDVRIEQYLAWFKGHEKEFLWNAERHSFSVPKLPRVPVDVPDFNRPVKPPAPPEKAAGEF
ncbi:MAG TPA: hypothetical protein VGP72_25905 [Planctomycetota bacterium]|jgi:hypothetical protein